VASLELGWVDFSKSERAKVLDVINLLAEKETLDELGIGPIRDGFANIFFPGTSTIQTRAKYFLIVPYALSDLERTNISDPQKLAEEMDKLEMLCGEILLKTSDEGVIGARNLKAGRWVKRTPADIYWSGLRTYGIFTNYRMTYYEYLKASCLIKSQKKAMKQHLNRKEDADEGEKDDADAGNLFDMLFWKLPEQHDDNWLENLQIELTHSEAVFLKRRIIESCPNSLMAFILDNNLRTIAYCEGFNDMADALLPLLPDNMKNDILLAKSASEFIYGIRIRYNIILSQGLNDEANKEWEIFKTNMAKNADVDIGAIFARLLTRDHGLYRFLTNVQKLMKIGNDEAIAEIDRLIINRECALKTKSRAKLQRAGEFPTEAWFCGRRLDYRFYNAMKIIRDIFDGEAVSNA